MMWSLPKSSMGHDEQMKDILLQRTNEDFPFFRIILRYFVGTSQFIECHTTKNENDESRPRTDNSFSIWHPCAELSWTENKIDLNVKRKCFSFFTSEPHRPPLDFFVHRSMDIVVDRVSHQQYPFQRRKQSFVLKFWKKKILSNLHNVFYVRCPTWICVSWLWTIFSWLRNIFSSSSLDDQNSMNSIYSIEIDQWNENIHAHRLVSAFMATSVNRRKMKKSIPKREKNGKW